MKPKRLRMKAFISYREEQEIDFTRFTDGLFLVEGDIGAGKTTIFDAISFALFGEASGKERKTDDLHCNLVSKGTDTEVDLEFTQSGKTYRVERKIRYTLTRGTKDDYKDPKQQAVLYIPDGDVINGQENVNRKIGTIIGLNKEQFEKIIMLAQGEFRKFLDASSEDKAVILKKLIDVTEYEKYQGILEESYKMLKKERENNDVAIKNHMETAFLCPDNKMFSGEMFFYGNPDLLDNLNCLKESDEAAVTTLAAEHTEKENKVTDLAAKKEKAKNDNQNINDLMNERDHLKKLQDRSSEMKTLVHRLNSVSVVVNKISRVIDEHNSLEKKNIVLNEEINQLAGNIQSLKAEVKAASDVVNDDKNVSERIENIRADVAGKKALLSKYDDYDELVGKIKSKESDMGANNESLEKASGRRQELEKQENEARSEKETLVDPSETKNNAQTALAEIERKCKSFNELVEQHKDIIESEKGLLETGEKLSKLMRDAGYKENVYHDKYRQFMDGQAALLAKDLGIKIETSGEANCPVCGTHFVKGDMINLANAEGSLVEEDELKEAEREYKEANDAYQKCNSGYNTEKSLLKSDMESALKLAQELFDDCYSWEDLSCDYLTAKEHHLTAEYEAREEALKQAEETHARYNELVTKIEELTPIIVGLKTNEATLATSVENLKLELDGLNVQKDKLRTELEFDSKDQAEVEIRNNESKADELQKKVDEHKKSYDELSTEQTAKETSLREKKAQQKKLEEEIERNNEALNEVLVANNFSTPDDALAIIEGIDDPDEWIRKTTQDLNDYNNDVTNTEKVITELEEKTRDQTIVDIEALNAEINKAKSESGSCNEELIEMNKQLANHKTAYEVVKENWGKNAATERAWSVLDRLAPMANGSNSEGGKITFDRYILGAFFAELLEKANRNLIELTGGRYQLNHKTTADRSNAAAGLDVEVINMSESSVISKGSLSGGEKFLTSLSLALGLSELAQDYFGGQTLDSLFIDEGFGTLDDKSLSLTMNVLNNLTGNNSRLVGIISHVDVSDYPIPHKIHVEKRGSASTITRQW